MKYIKYLSLSLLFVLSITACEPNYDETEIVTTEEPSKELPTARVTGQVRNMANVSIANATVHVMHNLEIHDVTTDSDGWYELNLPLDHSVVRLQAESGGYSNANIVIQHLLESELTQDLYLAQAGDMPYDYQNSTAITDSLKTISGFLEYADGNPIVGEVIFLIDYASFDINTYAVSDENGFFAIAVEPFDNHTLIVTGVCSNLMPIFENFSVADEDLDLGTIMVGYPSADLVNFSGIITNCNTGQPLAYGDVFITIGTKTVSSKVLDGAYSIDLANCEGETCYNILIKSPLVDGQINLTCEEISGVTVDKDYELCGDPIALDGTIDLLIDGNSFIYQTASASLSGGSWQVEAYDPATLETILFIFPDTGLGVTDVILFGIADAAMIPIYTASTAQTDIKIDVLDNAGKLSGNFSGSVMSQSQEVVPILGSFDINL